MREWREKRGGREEEGRSTKEQRFFGEKSRETDCVGVRATGPGKGRVGRGGRGGERGRGLGEKQPRDRDQIARRAPSPPQQRITLCVGKWGEAERGKGESREAEQIETEEGENGGPRF